MDKDVISNIKSLALDMINEAKSGHPGIVLSSAPILYTLYKYHLNINPVKPDWYNRDRFIMSAGHGSALLYSVLYMAGYELSIDDLKQFRCINSKTPGHPEVGITKGVECSTGPLGQGIATAVGIALGEKVLNSRFKLTNSKKQKSIIDFDTYVLVGDGDLMEGVSYEACSLAVTLELDNLIILYDSNNMTLDGSTNNTFKENVCDRFKAMGFDVFKVKDGNNIKQLNFEINRAKRSKKPAFIEIKTHLGYGSLLEDNNKVHGTPLTKDDLEQLKNKLSIPQEPFYVNESARRDFIGFIAQRVGDKYNDSIQLYNEEIKPNINSIYKDLKFYFDKNTTYDISGYKWHTLDDKKSLRDVNKYVLNEISNHIEAIIGGSADLNSSTKAYIDFGDDICVNSFNGKNIWYGIREHAMGSISNGLALLGFRPFASTFLTFSDYLKPAIRMSALMNLPVIYIFTHDSVTIGKDGPTHQPIEQISSLRAIPNLNVYRPVDLKEIIGCFQSILNHPNTPSALIISRSEEIKVNNTSATNTLKGAYVIKDAKNSIATIIATGTEVITALKIAMALEKNNIFVNVVSMPCVEIFLNQPKEYQDQVLSNNKRIVIEASSSFGWGRITNADNVISIDTFGKSGDALDVLKYVKFDIQSILDKVINIINKN